jgi:cytochrome bd-type quinol oxidase subunit 2
VPISTLVVVGQLMSPLAWILLVPFSLLALASLAGSAAPRRRTGVAGFATAAAVGLAALGLATYFEVPGPSFDFPWRPADWLLFLPLLAAVALLIVALWKANRLAAWVLASVLAMIGIFIAVYVASPYPFAWLLGTSSERVVVGPTLFLAALAPLLLERSFRQLRRPDG